MTPADRAQARRVFEETLQRVLAKHLPTEDVVVDACVPDATGQPLVVARYKLHTDGSIECFAILDEVLWPTV